MKLPLLNQFRPELILIKSLQSVPFKGRPHLIEYGLSLLHAFDCLFVHFLLGQVEQLRILVDQEDIVSEMLWLSQVLLDFSAYITEAHWCLDYFEIVLTKKVFNRFLEVVVLVCH